MVTLPPMPDSIAALPRDERGYPVPWFVQWIDGKPEFRVANGVKWTKAVAQNLCWVCGQPIGQQRHVFVIGPMCAVNRTTGEPPCHGECAEFSAKACPFLAHPKAQRREANKPIGGEIAGIGIMRNPGVSLLWYCCGYKIFDDGRGGKLFRLPSPTKVRFWCEGRKATREEILESINTGLQILEGVASNEGMAAVTQLRKAVNVAMKLVPA